ncbi:MAG: hypothetical protein DRJ09_01595 [Bacteroidetes bacterium]|nr:MAG: hypothetical protein DRJ09_01595 [Bacteroidota bacterium]
MRKVKIYIVLLLVAITAAATAQITVVTADKGPAADGNGLYYSLPATMFKVEVDLRRVESVPGPLAEYCENYLGTDDYIKASSVVYTAVDAKVIPFTIADENASYYMVFSEKVSKEDKPPRVELTPLGTLKSVNMYINSDNQQHETSKEIEKTIIINDKNDHFDYEAEFNKKQLIDTVVRKITIDTMTISKFLFKTSWVAKTAEERAEDAARHISLIREQRMNLLTGYHEVNFGAGIEYMDNQLKEMEQQYLELFQGKKRVSFEHYTFFVRPEKDTKQKELMTTTSGDKLMFKVQDFLNTVVKPMGAILNNVVYYRIPANAAIEVTFKDESLFKDIFEVKQLGVVSGVSVYKAGVIFDTQTGVPVKVRKY